MPISDLRSKSREHLTFAFSTRIYFSSLLHSCTGSDRAAHRYAQQRDGDDGPQYDIIRLYISNQVPQNQSPLTSGYGIASDMIKIMKEAIDEITALPESDQEIIGRQLLSHVEKLRRLRVEIDRGERSLDTGQGRELDIDAFVARAIGGN